MSESEREGAARALGFPRAGHGSRDQCRTDASRPAVGVHDGGDPAPSVIRQRVRGERSIDGSTCLPGHRHAANCQVADSKTRPESFADGRAAPLALALVQGAGFSAEELVRMRRLLDEAAAGGLSRNAEIKS